MKERDNLKLAIIITEGIVGIALTVVLLCVILLIIL